MISITEYSGAKEIGNNTKILNPNPTPPTPHQLNYRLPAEWEPHEGTWISWPKDPTTFPKGIIERVEETYIQMIHALLQGEIVHILVNDEEWEKKVRGKLDGRGVRLENVIFHRIKSADVWTRDYAPIFVRDANGKVAATKWIFNAWGNKYTDLLPDNQAGEEIAKATGLPVFHPGIVLEGGSIDVNGKGILLTTEQCLLNKNRNPQIAKPQIEQYVQDYLGIERVVWLKEGIAGDDTDGHVDDFARFVSEKKVVCAMEDDPKDENYKPLKENARILKDAGLEVIPLPMPKKQGIPERRLPVSYANFYIGNGVVLLPVFNDPNDKEAIRILQECFPKRKIVPIYARDLVYGYGGIHCATMQQPSF